MTESNSPVKQKKSRKRNPAFPSMSLQKAIDRAVVLNKEEGRKPMAPKTACKHWGLSDKSSSALASISVLKQFGLLDDEKVDGHRKLKLSDLALKIILDKREPSPERDQALQTAALSPKIYKELWKRRGEDDTLPSDAEMHHYLTLERHPQYYDDVVTDLIKDFKATIAYAKLDISDMGGEDRVDDDDNPPLDAPEIGSFVQWTSQGVAQFKTPCKVTGLSPDGQWVFVEGHKSAAPVGEITEVEPPKGSKNMGTINPPANPNYVDDMADELVPISVLMGKGVSRVISIPKMSAKAFSFFKNQLNAFEEAIVEDDDGNRDETA